jgi:hypothetical protein
VSRWKKYLHNNVTSGSFQEEEHKHFPFLSRRNVGFHRRVASGEANETKK